MTNLSPADTDLLRRQLEDLGLTPYQARALAALLVAGAANSVRLAELAGVQRTSIYRTMDTLTDQGLAETVPTHGPTVWACQGWRPVLDTLDAAAQQRLDQHQSRTRQLRHTLTRLLPDNESIARSTASRSG